MMSQSSNHVGTFQGGIVWLACQNSAEEGGGTPRTHKSKVALDLRGRLLKLGNDQSKGCCRVNGTFPFLGLREVKKEARVIVPT